MDEERKRGSRRPATNSIHEFEIGNNLAAFLERVLNKLDYQNEIREKLEIIMSTQTELNEAVAGINESLASINETTTALATTIADERGEVAAAIQALTDIINSGVTDISGVTAVRDSLTGVKTNLDQAVRDAEAIHVEPVPVPEPGPPNPDETPVP